MKMQEVVVVAAKRTAIGSFLGSLKQTEAVELVSMLTKSLLDKTAFIVNMLCGSGLKAIELGYDAISLNRADLLLCGGVENMSLAPFLFKNARLGYKMGDQNLVDGMIKDGIWCALSDCHMGITAENLAKNTDFYAKSKMNLHSIFN